MVVQLKTLTMQVPEPPVYVKMHILPVFSELTMRSHYMYIYKAAPPYDFLNLYGACLAAARRRHRRGSPVISVVVRSDMRIVVRIVVCRAELEPGISRDCQSARDRADALE
jgi:hypothetical protein